MIVLGISWIASTIGIGGIAYLLGKANTRTLSQFVDFVQDRDDREEAKVFRAVDQINSARYYGKEMNTQPPKAEGELTRKYSDVSNKYNEILEVTTASHQAIGTLMAEFSDFKENMKYRLSRLEYYNLSAEDKKEYVDIFENGIPAPDKQEEETNGPPAKVSDILKNKKKR